MASDQTVYPGLLHNVTAAKTYAHNLFMIARCQINPKDLITNLIAWSAFYNICEQKLTMTVTT